MLGWQIDRLDLDQTVAACLRFVDRDQTCQHFALNAAVFAALESDTKLREIAARCELISADGQSVIWASRLLGDPLPERVAAPDLMNRLIEAAASRGYRVYVLGAREEQLERAVAYLHQRHPALKLVGHHHGYFTEAEEEAICAEIRACRPQMLFVAITSPKKDYWIARHRDRLGVPLLMGVGGAIDIVAGAHRRAPRFVQRLGLEWLFRLLQEPRRLAGRYVATNSRFIFRVLRELLRVRLGRHPA